MEIGAGWPGRNVQPIANLGGDPEVEFAKSVLRAAGRPFDPMWTKERLLYELQQVTQAAITAAAIRARVEEEADREQIEVAALRSYRLGTAPTNDLPSESEDHR